MQTLYIADFTLPGDIHHGWHIGRNLVDRWTRERLKLDITDDSGPASNGELGTSGHVQERVGGNGSRLRTWRTRRVDPPRPLLEFDVTAWLYDDRAKTGNSARLRIRLGVRTLHGRVAEVPQSVGAPRPVRDLLDAHEVLGDGWRLGHHHVIGVSDVDRLRDRLLDPDRTRPVVALTTVPGAVAAQVDPAHVARRLGGLAHVVVLNDRSATYALSEALGGNELTVFGGAARLYMPGMQVTDQRGQHPLWLAERVDDKGRGQFTQNLFNRLGRLSALALGPPALEAGLRREIETARRVEGAQKLAALTHQYNEALRDLDQHRHPTEDEAAGPAEGVDEDWFAEHERVVEELEQTADERDSLQGEVDRLRDDLATAHDNIRAMASAAPSDVAGTDADEEDEAPATADDTPSTVREAVALAAATCPHLVLLAEAHSSARESEYQHPQQVLDDLRALDRVAAAWARDALPAGGFGPALVDAGVTRYRTGISNTARQKYASDYERTYQGATITLGPTSPGESARRSPSCASTGTWTTKRVPWSSATSDGSCETTATPNGGRPLSPATADHLGPRQRSTRGQRLGHMDHRLLALDRRVAEAADAWLSDPRDAGVYGRLVNAVEARRAYLNPTLIEPSAGKSPLDVRAVGERLTGDPAAMLRRLRDVG